MARDPIAPVDPVDDTQREEVNPSKTLPDHFVPETPGPIGGRGNIESPVEWNYYLRDGVTPYRRRQDGQNLEVFARNANGWMTQNALDPDDLWPSTANEIAGLIGGEERLTEPVHGVAPYAEMPGSGFAPDETEVQEADASADSAPPPAPDPGSSTKTSDDSKQPPAKLDAATASAAAQNDAYQGAGSSDIMHERHIRDAGLGIDLPFETPSPVPLKYGDQGQQAWTPPPGFRLGMPPVDPQLAENLGVERDLSQPDAAGGTTPVTPGGSAGQPDTSTQSDSPLPPPGDTIDVSTYGPDGPIGP